jgi:hypothetical protein
MAVNRRVSHLRKEVNQITGPLYSAITPEERFRLAVQAEAANDETEVKRLMETCPKKTYTQRDAAVVDRMEKLEVLVLAFCLDVAVPLAKLKMLQAQTMLLGYLRNRENDEICQAWYDGYKLGGGSHEDAGEDLPLPDNAPAAEWFLGVTQRLIRGLGATVLEHWEAFSQFCLEDLGLDPETLVTAIMAPALETVQEVLTEMKAIEADPLQVEERRDLLGQLWRKLAGLESN